MNGARLQVAVGQPARTFSALSVEPMNDAVERLGQRGDVRRAETFSALSVEPMNDAQREALSGDPGRDLSVLSLLSR